MRTENAKKQGSIVSFMTLRNLLFLAGAFLFLFLPSARRAFAVIIECTGCSCNDFSIGVPAFCSAFAYCAPEGLWIRTEAKADYECPGDFPTTTHSAITHGVIDGNFLNGDDQNSTVYGTCPSAWTVSQCDGYQTGGSSGSDLCCYP